MGTFNVKEASLVGVIQEQRNIGSVRVMQSVVKRCSKDLDPSDNKQLKFKIYGNH